MRIQDHVRKYYNNAALKFLPVSFVPVDTHITSSIVDEIINVISELPGGRSSRCNKSYTMIISSNITLMDTLHFYVICIDIKNVGDILFMQKQKDPGPKTLITRDLNG